jgi:protein-S-isoprenylcysteine O-methyltransferase Ste14
MVFNLLVAVSLVALLAYMEVRARSSRVEGRKGGYSRSFRQGVVLLPLAVGVLILLQLAGIIHADIAVPSGVRHTLVFCGYVLFWSALGLLVWARESLGIHWAHAADFQVIPGQALVTDGPYRFIRHPIYTSLLLLFVGAELLVGSWLILLVVPLAVLVYWQARKEELLLAKPFGQTYADYVQSTGMFLPRFSPR